MTDLDNQTPITWNEAGPELYKALRLVMQYCNDFQPAFIEYDDWIYQDEEIVRTAILKAEKAMGIHKDE